MVPEKRLLMPDDRIFDLVDLVIEDGNNSNQEVIIIDGKGYERELKKEDVIYNLEELLEKGPGIGSSKGLANDDIRKIAAEVAEKIAREIIPDIAERIIREEIEKLKSEDS